MAKAGRKGKYAEWLKPESLLILRSWARKGLLDKEIALKIGINTATLYEWKNQYPEFADAIKQGKFVADAAVENAVFKKAIGFKEKIKKPMKIKHVTYHEGKRVREDEEIVMTEEEVYIPPDTTCAAMWLNNRLPEEWRKNPDSDMGSNLTIVIKDDYGEEDNADDRNTCSG